MFSVNGSALLGLSGDEGSQRGFDLFFQTNRRRISGAVFGIVQDREAAEDIAQEAFARAFLHWKKISGYDDPYWWVKKVAIRLALKSSRRERLRSTLHRKVAARSETQDDLSDPDLSDALAALSPMQRAAAVLTYFEGLTSPEIANVLDCSEATVRVHLHRARERLRDALGDTHG